MAIDPKININENQVIFKKSGGHMHDGLTSSLIDYTKYSLSDFVVYPVAAAGTPRRRMEETNIKNLETFIVNAVERRVLNPKGIRIQANAITANEIVSGTITAGELASNIILVNNVIKSNNYNGATDIDGNISESGNAGWVITNTGEAEFNNVIVRGNVQASSGNIGGWDLSGSDLYAGSYVADNEYGQYVKLGASGEIQAYRKDFNYGLGEYWVRVDINGENPGLTVTGDANESNSASYITSSTIYAGLYLESNTNVWAGAGYGLKTRGAYTYIGGDSDSISTGTMRVVNNTALYSDSSTTSTNKLVCITSAGTLQVYGGVANTYASFTHNHNSDYLSLSGGTLTGILYGTGVDMSGNIRYGGKVYSDANDGYAEFGAIGAPNSIGSYVFKVNQVESLWNRSLAPGTSDRDVYINSASTLFVGANVSSERYKNSIVPADLDIDNFLKINVVNFYYNDELWDYESNPEKELQLGVIVENLDELGLTDLVGYDTEGRPDSLKKQSIQFYLLKVCQVQEEKIKDLQTRLQALESV